MLTKLHTKKDRELHLQTNGSTLVTKQQGYLQGIGWVWYHTDAITNVLSLLQVKQKYPIIYNSRKDNIFHVIVDEMRSIDFQQNEDGLYIYHLNKSNKNIINFKDFNFIQTVKENAQMFTK